MGTPPTPPPPGVETNLSTPEGEQPKTVRERLEQHRKDASCNACHGVIDPYGLALENFTAIGAWRDFDKDAGAPIDPRAELSGGRPVDGPVALARSAARARRPVRASANREAHDVCDRPRARVLRHAAGARRRARREAEDYRFSALVAGIVQSDAFRMQAVRREADIDSVRLRRRRRSMPRASVGVGEQRHVLDEEASVPAHGSQSRRRVAELAAARRDDPRAHGARADGGRAEAARRVLLYPARRDHVEHAVRQGRSTRGRRAAPAPTSS